MEAISPATVGMTPWVVQTQAIRDDDSLFQVSQDLSKRINIAIGLSAVPLLNLIAAGMFAYIAYELSTQNAEDAALSFKKMAVTTAFVGLIPGAMLVVFAIRKVPKELINIDELKISSTNVFDPPELQQIQVLAAGSQRIMIQHGHQYGQIININTVAPIYRQETNTFGGRVPPDSPCLIMQRADYDMLQRTIHNGAFGGLVADIGEGFVAVWKIPADLLYIENFAAGITTLNGVGTYPLANDANYGSKPDPTGLGFMSQNAEKIRRDRKLENGFEVTSVHEFIVDKSGTRIPGISTGNFFKNFNHPTQDEQERVEVMIQALKEQGIYAFSCNNWHHAVILYATINDDKYTLMTPAIFANLLGNNDPIFEAIETAAKGKDMNPWKEFFIATFGEEEA